MTKQIIINGLMFTTGAAIGSLVTWKIMKIRCDKLIAEEVEAFKNEWPSYASEGVKTELDDHWDGWNGCEDEEEDEDDDSDDIFAYDKIASKYVTADNGKEGGGDDEVFIVEGPIVISPDEFNDIPFEWTMYALTYYEGDAILADDWLVKQDIDDTIGEEALECFGKYSEEDVVHVRNEENMAHYEVVRDPRKYADVLASSIPRVDMNAY